MIKSLLTLLIMGFLCGGLSLSAQTYIQSTMYHYSNVFYNPAAVGATENMTLQLLGREQWAGVVGNPRLFAVSLDGKIEKFGGLGLHILRDELGPLASTGINLAYAYQQEVGDGGMFSIGVQAGFLQKSLSAKWKYPAGSVDPRLGGPGQDYSQSIGTLGLAAGLMYRHNDDRFYLGLSGQNLLEPSLEGLLLSPNVGVDSKTPRTFYLLGGYKIDMASYTEQGDNYIMPTFMARTDGHVYQFDVGAQLKYKVIYFGLNLRGAFINTSSGGSDYESIGAILGFDLSDRTFVGYSYDYNLSSLNINGGALTHEIVFTYRFKGGGGKTVIEETPMKDNSDDN